MTAGEYWRLRDAEPRSWPEPVNRLLEAVKDAPDVSWYQRAACRGMTHLFFPDYPKDRSNYTKARAICDDCPVSDECREAGKDEQHGMWGGTSPTQRARARLGQGRRKSQPDDIIAQAVELAATKTDAEVGRRFGVHVRTVQTWRRNAGVIKGRVA